MMAGKTTQKNTTEPAVTVEEVNRVLEVGRLLLSVLTPEEVEQLEQFFALKVARPPTTFEPVSGVEADR